MLNNQLCSAFCFREFISWRCIVGVMEEGGWSSLRHVMPPYFMLTSVEKTNNKHTHTHTHTGSRHIKKAKYVILILNSHLNNMYSDAEQCFLLLQWWEIIHVQPFTVVHTMPWLKWMIHFEQFGIIYMPVLLLFNVLFPKEWWYTKLINATYNYMILVS